MIQKTRKRSEYIHTLVIYRYYGYSDFGKYCIISSYLLSFFAVLKWLLRKSFTWCLYTREVISRNILSYRIHQSVYYPYYHKVLNMAKLLKTKIRLSAGRTKNPSIHKKQTDGMSRESSATLHSLTEIL